MICGSHCLTRWPAWAVTALRIRDEGGPKLCGQMLLYPVTDYHTLGTPSYAESADGYGLTRDTMEWFWEHYLANPVEAENPYASPLRARDLAGLLGVTVTILARLSRSYRQLAASTAVAPA